MSARRPIDLVARQAALDDADDAGPADAGDHLVAAELLQLLGDDPGRAVDVVVELGMRVEVLPPGGDLIGRAATRLMIGMGDARFVAGGRSAGRRVGAASKSDGPALVNGARSGPRSQAGAA